MREERHHPEEEWDMLVFQFFNIGAIVSGGKGKAEDKVKALRSAGAHVCDSPAQLGATMLKAMKERYQ